ncbi:peptidoglycan DD-metalloendopeptidase family protein [Sneathiella limimaris]|uniref:peptidoglycan DD-metalloendopeptidase family protein n=1 Tax=Sneathiella limimaris TaxID=1964213 RepID=UPI00146CA98F|nr:peptidoglycan DD-metalloendopeptidase family protein [Sneathiella limimaris]
MARNLNKLTKLGLLTLVAANLSGCVYDRYLQKADSRNLSQPQSVQTRVASSPSTLVNARAPSYYDNIAYRHVTVQSGDSLTLIAKRHRVPFSAVVALNGSEPPYLIHPGQLIKVPDFRLHRVKSGETLYAISRVYNVEMSELAHFNFLQAPYALTPGTSLSIPQNVDQQTRVAAVGKAAWAVSSTPTSSRPVNEVGDVASKSLPVPRKSVAVKSMSAPGPIKTSPVTGTKPVASQGIAAPKTVSQVQKLDAQDKPVQVASIAPEVVTDTPVSKPVIGTEIPAAEMPPVPKARYTIKSPPSREGGRFSWPAKGDVISGYGRKASGFHNDGINIRLQPGTEIRAAENGVVSYVGNEMRSFGNLVLISHADGYVTTYGHLATMSVYKGQRIQKGEVIGTAGATGDVQIPQLHFEIRKNGAAKNPKTLLASR